MELTIVIPVYNRENYLERTVQSIFDSGVEVHSLFLVDNNSTDGSLALCRKLAGEHDCIKVFTAEKQGAAVARNVGLDHCTTEWVYFFDSDDIFTGLPRVENEADYDVVCFSTRMVEKKGKEKVRWFPTSAHVENQVLGAFISTVSALYRTAWLREKGLRWNEKLLIWDDWELGARVLLNHPRIKLLHKKVYHRIFLHDDSITGESYAHNAKGKYDAIRQLDRYIADGIMQKREKEYVRRGIDVNNLSNEENDRIFLEVLSTDDFASLYALYLQSELTAGRVIRDVEKGLDSEELKGSYPPDDTLFTAMFVYHAENYKKFALYLRVLTALGVPGLYRMALKSVADFRKGIEKSNKKK
jgi:glycosyltransferase involved in cell wall biosynthesis